MSYTELMWNKYSRTDNSDEDESYMCINTKMAYSVAMCSSDYIIIMWLPLVLNLNFI